MSKLTFVFLSLLVFQHSFSQNIDKKLANELSIIFKADQEFRVAAIEAGKKYGRSSKQDNDLMHKQDSADLSNLEKIEKIIATYGYPGKTLVGAQSKVAFLVVQHNDLQAQEKYLPLFIEAVKKGELDSASIPLMVDRVRTAKGQPQLYGTQLLETKSGRVQIFPIEDEKNVNIRRAAAGLNRLEDYYKQWSIDYVIPMDSGNPNPDSLYVKYEDRGEKLVEAVGGDTNISSKVQYPKKARANNITGAVIVEYTVDKVGNTKNIEVVKSLGYDCDEEAIRVISEAKYRNATGENQVLRMKLLFPYK